MNNLNISPKKLHAYYEVKYKYMKLVKQSLCSLKPPNGEDRGVKKQVQQCDKVLFFHFPSEVLFLKRSLSLFICLLENFRQINNKGPDSF